MIKLLCVLALAGGFCQASIIYNVNLTVQSGGVTGTITTDGNTGFLNPTDITAFDLLLNDGTNTYDLSGTQPVGGWALAGAIGGVGMNFQDLSATLTTLSFNFSATAGTYLNFQYNINSAIPGNPGVCFEVDNTCAGTTAGVAIYNVNGDPTVNSTLSGTQVIGTASTVPEPSALLLLGSGVAVLAFVKRRVGAPRLNR